MGLYQLVYQSQSLVPFSPQELTALLHHCRGYNQMHYITGLLLYTPDGRFLQVLEGEQDAVRHLYCDRIMADARHHECHVLSENPCLHRSFSTWSMGFRAATPHDVRTLLSAVAPDHSLAVRIPRAHTCAELVRLLLDFVALDAPLLEQPG